MSIPTSLTAPSFLDFLSLSQQSHDSHLYDGNHRNTFLAQTYFMAEVYHHKVHFMTAE